MSEKLKPVRCGCGGEAEIDWVLEPSNCYMANVYCNKCGMKTIRSFRTVLRAERDWSGNDEKA